MTMGDEMTTTTRRWGIPFCERNCGMVWVEAKTKEEALEKFEDDLNIYDHMDYCGDCETDFHPEEIEEG